MLSLKKLKFRSYKAFKETQDLELKPITILIGKNSSGKSAISKLPLLLSKSFGKEAVQPIKIKYQDIEFGGTFSDIVFNKFEHGSVEFEISWVNSLNDEIKIAFEVQNFSKQPIQAISKWSISSIKLNLDISLDTSTYVYNKMSDIEYNSSLGKLIICFKGAFPISIINQNGENLFDQELQEINGLIGKWAQDVNYIGPFRAFPDRIYRHLGEIPEKIGYKGEFAPHILGMSTFLSNDTVENVGNWFKENLGGWKLAVDENIKSFEIVLESPDNPEVRINIADVGQGMSQVLPLIVRCFTMHNQNSIEIIEQPELHLHPAAHAALAELFCKTAKNVQSTFIIETHSENFILRVRRLIVEGVLSPDDVVIYWIDDEERPGSSAHKITINAFGEVNDWPSGIFSEDHEEVLAIKRKLRETKEHVISNK